MTLSILIADDHEVTLLGLKNVILGAYPDARIVHAVDGERALDLASRLNLSLVVLDISMPRMNGIQVLKELRARGNQVPIIILTANEEEGAPLLACRLGAWAFVRKDGNLREIRDAIAALLRRERFVGPSLKRSAPKQPVSRQRTLFRKLSEQELEVFMQLAQGRGSKEIAERLSISYKTVRTYRARLFRKLQLRSDAQAVLLAVKSGLV